VIVHSDSASKPRCPSPLSSRLLPTSPNSSASPYRNGLANVFLQCNQMHCSREWDGAIGCHIMTGWHRAKCPLPAPSQMVMHVHCPCVYQCVVEVGEDKHRVTNPKDLKLGFQWSEIGTKGLQPFYQNLSSFVWLAVASNANFDTIAISHWIASFGELRWLVTDQGSHFKNELMQKWKSESRIHQHFTTAYSPWSNGSVERICREVLCFARSLM